MEYSSLTQALPINIHLLTLEEWNTDSKNSVLLRLEHFFEAQEDPEGLSKPVNLELQGLFRTFDIENMEEVLWCEFRGHLSNFVVKLSNDEFVRNVLNVEDLEAKVGELTPKKPYTPEPDALKRCISPLPGQRQLDIQR